MSQGCYIASDECICTADFQSMSAFIVDEASQPVDSAGIKLFRVSDSASLPDPGQSFGYHEKGKAIIFSDGYSQYYPKGKREMEIRAVASKDGKTGSALYVFGEDDCGCHFRKMSGPDTITIR